jgi:hypothetical protein
MNLNALPDTPTAPRRIPSPPPTADTARAVKPSPRSCGGGGRRDFYLGAFGSKASKAEYRRPPTGSRSGSPLEARRTPRLRRRPSR